ncbi:MAG: hypothetical protein NC489_31230 [Ruminococcus flavefaciens]|nr:hypothetical protein [Ruminococcus flavefaciens]
MNANNITTITAVWGAVTGSLSLLWNIYSKKLEKPHLKVQLSKRFTSFICPPDLIYLPGWMIKENVLVVNFLLKNTGNQPESITAITYYDYQMHKWLPIETKDFHIKRLNEKHSDGSITFHELPVGSKLSFPFDIQGNQSLEKKLFVYLNEEEAKQTKFKFCFETTNHNYHFSFQIQPLDHILPDWKRYTIS